MDNFIDDNIIWKGYAWSKTYTQYFVFNFNEKTEYSVDFQTSRRKTDHNMGAAMLEIVLYSYTRKIYKEYNIKRNQVSVILIYIYKNVKSSYYFKNHDIFKELFLSAYYDELLCWSALPE